MAEAAIALTYAIMRRVAEADRFVRAGRWLEGRMAPSRRVGGKHLGIVGLGRIGRRVAQRAEGIGMTVAYFGRRRVSGVAYPFVPDLLDLAAQADVLVLSCPGGEATSGLVGRDVLARLGPEGYLVNVSRGSVVDEPALLEALENRTIAGAALDVFAREPDLDPRFTALDNVRAGAAFRFDHPRDPRRHDRPPARRHRRLPRRPAVPRCGAGRAWRLTAMGKKINKLAL